MIKKLLVAVAALLFVGCGGTEHDAQVSQLIQACKRQNKVCICHVPPGNPANAHEICISKRAWRAHKRNHSLDYVGACAEKCYAEVEKCHTEYVRVCGECSCTYERERVCETVLIEVPCDEPRCDAGTSCADSQVPEEDASVPEEDAYVPQPDQSVPDPDSGVADAGTEEDATGSSDSGTTEDDQGVTESDADVVVEEDASTPDPVDAGTADAGVADSGDEPIDPIDPVDPVDEDEVLLVGGGGCAMTGQNVGNSFLGIGLTSLLLVMFLIIRGSRKLASILALATWALLTPGLVYAGPSVSSTLNSGAGAGDFIATRSAVLSAPTVGIMYDYAHRPLRVVLPNRGKTVYDVIDGQHNFQLTGAFSLFNRVELGINLPFTVYQDTDNLSPLGVTDLSAGLSDIQLLTKVRLYTHKKWDFSLGHRLGLPTSRDSSLLGETGVTFHPEALVSWSSDRVEVGANVGVKIRPLDQSFAFGNQNLSVNEELLVGIGTRVKVWENTDYRVNGLADVQLSLGLQELNEEEAPLELLVGGEVNLPYNLSALAGIGVGLTRGLNTPVVRPFVGLQWTWEAPAKEPCPPVVNRPPVVKRIPVPVPVIVPVPVAVAITLPTIYFDTDKATLRPEGIQKLLWTIEQLKKYPNIKTVRVEGHTDHRASNKYNQKLSERRVQAAVDFLKERGISLTRLDTRSYGETQRVDTTQTDDGMQNNRRVEFTVTHVE